MSDGIDPSTQVRRTRTDESNSSNGNLAIVLAVIAVVLGFLILRSLQGTSSPTVAVGTATTQPSIPVPTNPATTPPPIVPTTPDWAGATILVANANGKKGSASTMADALKSMGAATVEPTNAPVVETSQILYNEANPAALKVAQSLTLVLTPAPTPTPLVGTAPVDGGDTRGADVVLVLGKDLANATVTPPAAPVTTLTVPFTTPPAQVPAGSSVPAG